MLIAISRDYCHYGFDRVLKIVQTKLNDTPPNNNKNKSLNKFDYPLLHVYVRFKRNQWCLQKVYIRQQQTI